VKISIHFIAKRFVYKLMLLHNPHARELIGDDDDLEVISRSCDVTNAHETSRHSLLDG
jgi:hypothetical protein